MDVMIHRREEGVIHKSAPGAWALTFTMFALAVVVVIARVSTRIYYKHFGVGKQGKI